MRVFLVGGEWVVVVVVMKNYLKDVRDKPWDLIQEDGERHAQLQQRQHLVLVFFFVSIIPTAFLHFQSLKL